jgi:two-component system cell cycle sensor histidine kinase/response regulator CckA
VNSSLQKEVSERRRAEDRIRESDARTRAILNAIPDIMFQFDSDGRFVDVRGELDSLTMPPDQCIGRKIEHVMPAKLHECFNNSCPRRFKADR